MTEVIAEGGVVRFSAGQLRRSLLHVAIAGMEISWFTSFFLLLLKPARIYPPYLTAALLGGLLLAFDGWSALADRRQLDLVRERLVLLLALPLIILAGWRFFLHPDAAFLDLSWIQRAGHNMVIAGSRDYWVIVATVLFLWWRGLALSRREFTFESVAFGFRFGLLPMLVFGTLLLSYIVNTQVLAFIFPFFFFSLVAISLSRLEEVGQVKGDVGKLFDIYWVIVLTGAILLILAAGALLVLVARPEGIETLRSLWAPIGNALLNIVSWLLRIILTPFEPFLEWLARIFAQGWALLLEGQFAQILQDFQPALEQSDQEPLATPYLDFALDAVRWVCGAGLLLGLLLAGLWLLNKERRRLKQQSEEHETLEVNLRDALAGLLGRARNRLRGAANMVRHFGIGSDLLTAISVRNIYANTTRLARQRGYPRDRARTPYEFLSDLQAAFPQAQSEAQAITDAYVGVHYGELPTDRPQLEALRAAYERLKASPKADKQKE
jgi:hypothetical protein